MDKELIKMGTMHGLGAQFDDLLEVSGAAVHRHTGGKEYLVKVHRNILKLLEHIDKDIDEEKYDLDTAKLIKSYVLKAAGVADSLTSNADIQLQQAYGSVASLQSVVKITQREHAVEKQKYEAKQQQKEIIEAITPEDEPKVTGKRPGPTLKEQRQAEAKPKKRGRPKKKKDGKNS